MTTNKNTIVRQFWSHVFTRSSDPSALVANKGPMQDTIIVTGGGHYGMGPSAVTLKRPTFRTLNWQECGYLVAEIMLFLRERGVKAGDRVAILSWNSPEWIWTDLAIQSLGAVTVPIYPNSASDQVNFILGNAGARLLLVDGSDQAVKVDPASGIETFFFADALAQAFDYNGEKQAKITPLDNPRAVVVRKAAKDQVAAIRADFDESARFDEFFLDVTLDQPSTFIYTSGSTGVPKGVVLTHRNIASACLALMRLGFTFNADDVYLSYLPLAHVYERVNGSTLSLWNGVPAAYCRVDEMVKVVKEVRPTIMLGVPAVWRKIKDGVQTQIDEATGIKAKLIGWAFRQKNPGIARFFADLLVFKKIRGALGGRVRLMLSGGAPIAPDILNFFDLVGFNLRQGYGLTETSGGVSVNTLADNKVGSVGRVLDCVEVKIEQLTDSHDGSGLIWFRGDSITPGYWELPEANAASFKDGWFDTGDLGRMDEDGYLWITGRKKRLLKTDGGKYVAPEKLENAFDGAGELVQYVVPVGDGRPFIGALIFLNQVAARALATSNGATVPDGDAAAFLAADKAVAARVQEIVNLANAKLEHWETIKQFSIIPMEATVDNGLLTNKMSIRTEKVVERFGPMIDELYTRRKPS